MRGLLHLAWLELKIFLREPLGALGTVAVPALAYIGATMAGNGIAPERFGQSEFARTGLPVMAATLMLISAVLSLMTIVAVYREGGILRRLRATPLRPHTIVLAHVLVKLALTAATIALLAVLGRRVAAPPAGTSLVSFTLGLLVCTAAVLSLGFLLASVVPTARFAQPFGALVLYPMMGLSGLFFPVDALPPVLQGVAELMPLTHAVSLLQGLWQGHAWVDHGRDLAGLALTSGACAALASRVFRWE